MDNYFPSRGNEIGKLIDSALSNNSGMGKYELNRIIEDYLQATLKALGKGELFEGIKNTVNPPQPPVKLMTVEEVAKDSLSALRDSFNSDIGDK